jgi:hypothetical protein
VTQVVTLSAPSAQDRVALAEIELCGELMIAAADAPEDRLSPDRIDEVLNVRAAGEALSARVAGGAHGAHVSVSESVPTIPRQCRHRG